jgi:predicted nuclease of restriction endonuclease-like (RecB) superfamily
VKTKTSSAVTKKSPAIYHHILRILESARSHVARSVNTSQVVSNWLIGREIVEEEQQGKARAGYGDSLMAELAEKFKSDRIEGYSVQNLRYMRQFYITYADLIDISAIRHAVRGESPLEDVSDKGQSGRKKADGVTYFATAQIHHATSGESWKSGLLHPNLSWTHYRTLLRVDKAEARSFYEVEALRNNWAARELERQINSLLYERLALSRDKEGLMKLATKGQEIQKPADVFKDPVVIEFLGLPASPKLVESELEQALIEHLQVFLLELGRGFAFVARQQRITLDGDHFYIDLVFYHAILKCFVLIDLKVGKLTHQDLGQIQLYVNYFDRERRADDDNPSLGLILCTDKNDAVVKYTLGPDQQKKIFASRYKLHLPTEAELKAELRRELKSIGQTPGGGES